MGFCDAFEVRSSLCLGAGCRRLPGTAFACTSGWTDLSLFRGLRGLLAFLCFRNIHFRITCLLCLTSLNSDCHSCWSFGGLSPWISALLPQAWRSKDAAPSLIGPRPQFLWVISLAPVAFCLPASLRCDWPSLSEAPPPAARHLTWEMWG